MKKMELKRLCQISALLLFFEILCSCSNQFVKDSAFRRSGDSGNKGDGSRKVSLVCWNVQTFFDASTSGTEYKDFKNSERWTKEKYVKRLNKLCEVMTSLNPDIFVMEEIENEAVVQDIANTLAAGAWDNKKSWKYACFAKESGSAIGCAVFSRYEICSLRTHSLDIRNQKEEQPSSRPIMQVTLNTGGRELDLFVNHWKSKSGGEEETEIWRDWQELVLAERAFEAGPDPALVMCGDFNRSAEDFVLQTSDSKKTNTLLRGSSGELIAWSPWFRKNGEFAQETGSYYYNGEWERIDNIMIYGALELSGFATVTDSPLADEEGIPSAFKIYTGEGCSDHLPLKCFLSLI